MDTVRQVIALLLLVTFPAAISMWLLIHPLARFWRRRGPAVTYLAVGAVAALIAFGLFRRRDAFLREEFGFSWPLTLVAILCLAAAILIERQYRRHLGLATLLGLPEIAEGRSSELITEGIYGRIRHPRYLGILLEISAFALFANYLAAYLVVAAAVPLLHVIVLLEERELRDRFGAEYERYAKRVPRYIPRLDPSPATELRGR